MTSPPERIVLVAGGTGELGRAVCMAFLAAGARVAATYRNPDELERLRNAAGQDTARLDGERCDVTNEAAVDALVAGIVARHGRLDVLVNCVGGYAGGARLWETSAADLDRMLDLNLRAGFVLARAVAPRMVEQGSGAIVNVASKAAVRPGGAEAAYAASKAAAVAMIESLAADLRGTGVRANSVLPSLIDTEANRRAMPKADFAKWPKAGDIARVVVFLCSEDARLIHGAAIPVSGSA